MNRSRKARTRRITAVIAALLALIFVMTACSGQDASWTPTNLTGTGNVEKVACDQIDSATDTVNEAVSNEDTSALATIGLWVNGKLDENALNDTRDRLEAWKEKCSQGPPATTTPVSASPSDCPDSTALAYDPNRDMNVVSGGIENRTEDLAAIKKDPRNLAMRAHNLKLWDDPKNWAPLTSNEGKCLSTEGAILFAKVEGALTASTTAVDENAVAPAGYYNTGMDQDGVLVNPSAGITGDMRAIKYTLADGTVVIVLKRCANLALPSPPREYTPKEIPGSGGGNPPPTGPPPTNPPPTNPPVCPPGMTGQPPLCKDTPAQGPAQVVPEQQRPNPLPVRPDHAQPTRPASPPSVYVPPPAPPVVVVPPSQGGPTAHPTPRPTPPAPETGAPAPTAPETECIPAPGASC